MRGLPYPPPPTPPRPKPTHIALLESAVECLERAQRAGAEKQEVIAQLAAAEILIDAARKALEE